VTYASTLLPPYGTKKSTLLKGEVPDQKPPSKAASSLGLYFLATQFIPKIEVTEKPKLMYLFVLFISLK